ncbi:DUF411 domain-containing protein [Mesorhizobium sp. Z1-4]|uniref:DUF411 domain-containing protein n=1 Tax=Mesorhizobium sp. Z1-4 TaxID=2448478 RepID=UPI000FDBCACD|nr:DUF411 domain-containing protein [Mesorhizobium sp. Z1-4]
MNKKTIAAAFVAVVAAAGIAYWSLGSANAPLRGSSVAAASGNKVITIWRDPGCGCCDAYADYLEGNGYVVTRVDDPNFDKRSIEAGVPQQGIGCHLAEIDGYVVSGLVPAEIIERLVSERPDITGITLPGMPANAPGMAPTKTGTLKTYAFGKDGVTVYSEE